MSSVYNMLYKFILVIELFSKTTLQWTSRRKVWLAAGGMPLSAMHMYVPIWSLLICVMFRTGLTTDDSVIKSNYL